MPDELFTLFEPKPPLCRATTVTMDNIHRLAEYFNPHAGPSTTTEVSINYDPEGASLTIKQAAYTPYGGGEEVPAVEISVHTGQMLVEYFFPPQQPVPQPGWNVVSDYSEFRREWRPTEGK